MSASTHTADYSAQPLPSNVYAEKLVLGAVMMNDEKFVTVAAGLTADDFSLEKHRRIFRRMLELNERQEKIDHVTVAHELMRYGELESVDGLTYIVSLEEGMPELYNLESYVQIVKQRSMLRQMIFLSEEIKQRCFVGSEDPEDILAAAEEGLIRLSEAHSDNELKSAKQVFDETEGGMDALLDPTARPKATPTGFRLYDEMTGGGMRSGELVILAARPAMGKTALALNMALNIATSRRDPRNVKGVAIFSLEMSKESLMTRLVCSLGHVDQQSFRNAFLDEDALARLKAAAMTIYSAPLYLDDGGNTSVADIRAKVHKLKPLLEREHGVPLGLVIVDYLQLMVTPNLGKNSNRVQEVSSLSRGLKLLSKELDVPFLVLSQLSRAVEQRKDDHRPQLSDLRESGSIEQDADIVNFIYRPEVYAKDEREDVKGHAELIVAKQRNGPTGKVPLFFVSAFTLFTNFEEGAHLMSQTPPPGMN